MGEMNTGSTFWSSMLKDLKTKPGALRLLRPFRPIPLTVSGKPPERGLHRRRDHLERKGQRVFRFYRHHPREQGVVAVGLDDVVLGETLEQRQRRLVGSE